MKLASPAAVLAVLVNASTAGATAALRETQAQLAKTKAPEPNTPDQFRVFIGKREIKP